MPSRTGRSYLILEGLSALVLVLFLPRALAPAAQWLDVLGFLAIMTLLSLFDIWLPHGDTVDIVGALAVSALVLLGPVPAIGIVSGARLCAHVLRHRFDRTPALLHSLSRRIIVLSLCGLMVSSVPARVSVGTGRYVLAFLVAAAFVAMDLVLQQAYAAARKRQSLGALLVGNLRLQGLMLAANISVSVLTVVLYEDMGLWSLLLMVILLIVMRQSFSMLLDIRQAYQATMEALAASIEAHDPNRQGHAERVAALARAIAIEIGFRGKDLERLGYAALLHDVDLLATDDTFAPPNRSSATASDILNDVRFLADVLPVLRRCEGRDSDVGFGGERESLMAYIVCRASNLDELLNQERPSARTRQYAPEFLNMLVEKDVRERVESTLWKLLTPGARSG